MKYHIQKNHDDTYTVLEIDGLEEAKCYVVTKETAKEMYNYAQFKQLQAIFYAEDGQLAETQLDLTKKMFRRNNSVIFPMICIFSILTYGFQDFSSLVFSAVIVTIFQVLQYWKMAKLKKVVDNQRYLFSVQPKIIKLRTTSQNLKKKYFQSMFAEMIPLILIFFTMGVAYFFNGGKQFGNQFFIPKRERITNFNGPLNQMFDGKIIIIVYVLVLALIGIYCASIYYLRRKDYTESEIINNYRGLRARLSNGDFLGWEFSSEIPTKELLTYGWVIRGRRRDGNSRREELINQTNEKLQILYQNRWQ